MGALRSDFSRPAWEKRGETRVPVDVEATVCSTSIMRRTVALTDMSTDGCRVASPFGWTDGTVVVITIPSLAPRAARVRWHNEAAVGLRFEDRLSFAVVDHIAGRGRA